MPFYVACVAWQTHRDHIIRPRRCRRRRWIHWFHWKFAEWYIIVNYRSRTILVIIRKILTELWPFFRHSFCCCVDIGFRSITFAGDALISLAVCRRIVKYTSISILVIIHKSLAELWPFYDSVFVVGVKYRVKILFPLNNFWFCPKLQNMVYY